MIGCTQPESRGRESHGLARLNNGQIRRYPLPGAQAASADARPHLQSLTQDNRGRIWVFTDRGVACLENDRFIPVIPRPGGVVYSSAADDAGNLWASDQNQGLIRLRGESVVERIPWAMLGRKDVATALFPDPAQGGLWLGFLGGGVAYFKDGQVRASYAGTDGLGAGRVSGLQLDRDGTLWAATEGGLSRVRNSRIATLTNKNGLPCDAVKWVVEDNARSFWLYMNGCSPQLSFPICSQTWRASPPMDRNQSSRSARRRMCLIGSQNSCPAVAQESLRSPRRKKRAFLLRR